MRRVMMAPAPAPALVLVLAAATAVAAPAAHAGVSSYEDRVLLPYFENEEYALFPGPGFEDGCRGEGYVPHRTHVIRPTDDRIIACSKFTEDISLYDLSEWGVDSGAELLDVACAAVSTEEGAVPTPIASGIGTIVYRSALVDLDESGFVDTVLWRVKGTVTGESNEVWSVRGLDKLSETYDGVQQVDQDVLINDFDVKRRR
ncbi:MAG: hypothetical protein WA892_07865 [Ornithinimicrobium sp.]